MIEQLTETPNQGHLPNPNEPFELSQELSEDQSTVGI